MGELRKENIVSEYNQSLPDPGFVVYLSNRGMPLVFNRKLDESHTLPTLTVENYMKWYDLYLVMPDGTVKALDLEEYLGLGFDMGDHCWKPAHVARYAAMKGYDICSNSFEMLIGRWRQDHEGVDYTWVNGDG